MRVTIEPTNEGAWEKEDAYPNVRVVVETASDEITATDALDLVKRALVSYGFHWENLVPEKAPE